jgi:hypothetical protein
MFVEDKQDTVKVKEEPDSNWFRQGVEWRPGNNIEFIVSVEPCTKTV